MRWIDDHEALYDIIQSKNIVPPDGQDVLDVQPEALCRTCYEGRFYKVKVIARGKRSNVAIPVFVGRGEEDLYLHSQAVSYSFLNNLRTLSYAIFVVSSTFVVTAYKYTSRGIRLH